MVTAALATSLSVLAGASGLSADLSAATGVREIDFAGGATRRTGELELVPRLRLEGERGPLRFALSYGPRLLLPVDLSRGSRDLDSWQTVERRGEILQRAALSFADADERGANLRVEATGEYGDTDLLHASDWEPRAVPVTSRVRLVSSTATAEVWGSPSARTRLSFRPGVFVHGGTNPASRELLPLQRGLTLESAATWNATRRDVVSFRVAGAFTRFDPRSESAHLRAGASWKRDLRPGTSLRLGGGIAGGWSDAPDPDVRGTGPWAEATVSHAGDRRLAVEASARLEPTVDPTNGVVQQRAEGSTRATWRPRPGWILSGGALVAATGPFPSGFHVLPAEAETRVALVEASVGRELGPSTVVTLGGWERRQSSDGDTGLPSFSEWGVSLRLAFRPKQQEKARPEPGSSVHGS